MSEKATDRHSNTTASFLETRGKNEIGTLKQSAITFAAAAMSIIDRLAPLPLMNGGW